MQQGRKTHEVSFDLNMAVAESVFLALLQRKLTNGLQLLVKLTDK